MPVFLHASWADPAPRFQVTWRAWYIGHVEGSGAGHPDRIRYRSPTTGKYPGDNSEWAVYWEVEGLEPIAEGPEQLRTGAFTGYSKQRLYGTDFAPEVRSSSGREEDRTPPGHSLSAHPLDDNAALDEGELAGSGEWRVC